MSRSNPTEHLVNPAVKFFEWNGGEGSLYFYDKEAKEKVTVELPFTCLPLDELHSVTGWSDSADSGIYSNAVKDMSDIMNVRTFSGMDIAKGVYKDIKDTVKSKGGKYCKNIYIAIKTDEGLKIACLNLTGADSGAWMEFAKKNDVFKNAVQITGSTIGKKGAITFHVPELKTVKVAPETDAEAIELDKELQAYLKAYLQRNSVERPVVVV